MNPYERRVVHMTVREVPGLTTVSEGEGFLKRVRVEKIAP
jgi:predicted RNA-binding protein Jag